MPPYRFLFERRRIEGAGSPLALQLPARLAPPIGYEIVPKLEAKALVAYLLSLRANADLFDAPMTVPVTPGTGTNTTPAQAAGALTPAELLASPTNATPAK